MEYCQECEIVKDARYIALERYALLSHHALAELFVLFFDSQADQKDKRAKALEIIHPVSEASQVLKDVRENLRQHELRFHPD